MAYTSVVSSHMNPSLSGVAKFNALLARRMGVPCVALDKAPEAGLGPLLLSVKFLDNGSAELESARRVVGALASARTVYDVFFHTFDGFDVEHSLVEGARRVFCGNGEIPHALASADGKVVDAWCPPLVGNDLGVRQAPLNLFSFGMAHKLQLRHYKTLHESLESFRMDYALWVSTAFHEKANFGDFDAVSRQMTEVFRSRIQFLGFLSDEAVNHFLDKTQLFVSFFPKGVRANNTSVAAAMMRGRAVLTNLDVHSPGWLKHGVNILDIQRLSRAELQPAPLAQIGAAASIDAARWSSWESLTRLLSS
jgi:hypothetical protein